EKELRKIGEADPDSSEVERWRELAPIICQGWLAAVKGELLPNLATSDGEPLVITKVAFKISSPEAIIERLSAEPSLEQSPQPRESAVLEAWTWTKPGV